MSKPEQQEAEGEEQQEGCQRRSATKAGRPIWDIKTKQNIPFVVFIISKTLRY